MDLGFVLKSLMIDWTWGGVGKGSRVKGSSFLTRSFGMTGDWSCLVTLIEDPGTEDVTLGLVSIQMVINVTRMKDPSFSPFRGGEHKANFLVKCTK